MQPEQKPMTLDQKFNLMAVAIQIMGRPLLALTLKSGSAGHRFFAGLHTVLGMTALFLAVVLGNNPRHPHQAWVGLLLWLFILCMVIHHNQVRRKLNKSGEYVHSMCCGTPRVGKWSQMGILAFPFALALSCASPAAGFFMIASSYCVSMQWNILRRIAKAEVDAINDARWHQQQIARHLNGG